MVWRHLEYSNLFHSNKKPKPDPLVHVCKVWSMIVNSPWSTLSHFFEHSTQFLRKSCPLARLHPMGLPRVTLQEAQGYEEALGEESAQWAAPLWMVTNQRNQILSLGVLCAGHHEGNRSTRKRTRMIKQSKMEDREKSWGTKRTEWVEAEAVGIKF